MSLSRRDFLKSSLVSAAGLVILPFQEPVDPWLSGLSFDSGMLGRVAQNNQPVYEQPDTDSPRLYKLKKDALISLLESIHSPAGPAHNPRWYRLRHGYVHSAYIQRVEAAHLNEPLPSLPPGGLLGEITVPYTQVSYQNRQGQKIPLYRLYYGSIHWIVGLEESPLGEPVYRLVDERVRIHYRIPARHVRPVLQSSLAPLNPELPHRLKRLEASIERQVLTAYEENQIIREMKVSTGRRYSPTPIGSFQVDRKYPNRHMGNGGLTSDILAYELVGVPWVSFFQTAGIAFHGTYWHANFGIPMSQGCVNLPTPDALWLFRWTSPTYIHEHDDRPTWKVSSKDGTAVVVV